MPARIAIAGFQHETNTFAPLPTTYENFAKGGGWPGLTTGEGLEIFRELNIPLGGFMNAGDAFDLIPILWTAAEPAAHVQTDAFDRIAGMICDALRSAEKLDGVYLDLHGAMVVADDEDGEGAVVRRVREVIGPDMPLVVSLDLHANITPEFVRDVSAVTIYRTYPHVDMADAGARAAALMADLLVRDAPYAKAFRQCDYLIPIQAQSTRRPIGAGLYEFVAETAKTVISADLAMGFPPADITHCGASMVAMAEDQAAADRAVDQMLARMQALEGNFHNPLIPAAEAVARAITVAAAADKPVVMCEPQDNPGAGATGDGTGLLAALVAGGARDAILGMFWDPETAAQAEAAGEGAEIEVTLGGKFDVAGPAFTARARVEKVSDGVFTCTGPMYGGSPSSLGPTASLLILDEGSEVRVVVGAGRSQNADQAMFSHLGLIPSEHAIVAVKSAVHFLADYEPIAEEVIFVDAPGANPCQLDRIPFTRLRNGVRLGPNGPAFRRDP